MLNPPARFIILNLKPFKSQSYYDFCGFILSVTLTTLGNELCSLIILRLKMGAGEWIGHLATLITVRVFRLSYKGA